MTEINFSRRGTGSVSRTMKSIGKKNLFTLMMTTSTITLGFLIDRLASCRISVVGFSSPRPSCDTLNMVVNLPRLLDLEVLYQFPSV
jgi:hypothetical protein